MCACMCASVYACVCASCMLVYVPVYMCACVHDRRYNRLVLSLAHPSTLSLSLTLLKHTRAHTLTHAYARCM
jgi:hypothetical protein